MHREVELAHVDAVLARARSGAGATLLIEGPAGIGKTSVLMRGRGRAASIGMEVLYARASQLERDYAMGVVRQAFEPVLRAHPEREALLAGAARLAGSVVLDVADDLDVAPAGVLHGLYWLTANLAERVPVMIVVDDAHWADEPSLRFLAYLARRVESIPVALLIGTRIDEQHASSGPLLEVRGDPATDIVRLRPLSPQGVHAFLRLVDTGLVDAEFAGACHAATGGNPFLLGELVRALQAEGVAFTTAAVARVTEVTPPTVARTVRATLVRLGSAAHELARAVTVFGDEVELDLAAALAGISMSDAACAAGDLARAGILEDATPLRFRHPILAGATRADLTASERADAHLRAAELLRCRGSDPERVAVQLMHSAPAGRDEVVTELRDAAERASARGAPGTAVTLLRRALAEPPTAATRPALLLALGEMEYAVGDDSQAAVHLEEAQRSSDDPVIRGRALVSLLQTAPWGGIGGMRAAAGILARAVRDVAPVDRELALRLRSSQLSLPGATPEEWHAAVAVAEGGTGATPGEALLLSSVAFGRTWAGSAAADVADVAIRAARHADALLENGAMAEMVVGVVLALRWADRLDEAERLLDRAVKIAQRRGSTTDFGIALSQRAAVHRRAGRLREAETDARMALAAPAEPGTWHLGHCYATLVGSLVDQGRVSDAAAELACADDDASGDSPAYIPLILERMGLHAALGDYSAALVDWEEAAGRAQRVRGLSPAWVQDLIVAAEAHHALADRSGTEALLETTLTLAKQWDTPGSVGQAQHAVARLGAGDDAVAQLLEAVEHLRRSPARLELARALLTLGSTLRRSGQRSSSREPLREAYELARQCGAEGLAETARMELRASGIRLRREALSGVDALTPSERRIAELAAEGASNREIAQGLFLTVKTVEMHLTRAYRKLDISRRAQLAEALSRNV